jgi:CHAT domain-containing protein
VGSLAFEDEHGDADLISGRTLGTLFKNTSARLAVLNACQSAQNAQNAQAFTGVGPALVDAGLPAVVAMQFIVGDQSARVLSPRTSTRCCRTTCRWMSASLGPERG